MNEVLAILRSLESYHRREVGYRKPGGKSYIYHDAKASAYAYAVRLVLDELNRSALDRVDERKEAI